MAFSRNNLTNTEFCTFFFRLLSLFSLCTPTIRSWKAGCGSNTYKLQSFIPLVSSDILARICTTKNNLQLFMPLRSIFIVIFITDVLLCTASIWSLLIIAVDRYTATFYPIWYRTKHQTRRLLMYITIIWVVSASTSLPPLFIKSMLIDSYRPDAEPPGCQLFDTMDFVLYSSVMTFILPAIILFILYGRIFCELKHR